MSPQAISAETWQLRQDLLRKYGGHCTCPCGCGESDLQLLQLHHLHGGGTQERKTVRGKAYYVQLLSGPVDPSLQAVCVSCHWRERMFGACDGGVSAGAQTRNGTTETGRQVERRQARDVEPSPFVHLTPAGIAAAEALQEAPPEMRAPVRRGWRLWKA